MQQKQVQYARINMPNHSSIRERPKVYCIDASVVLIIRG
jgi:hypothetical protein